MSLRQVSAIVLAGGKSSRMGCDKAELPFQGVTLVQHQVNKLRSMGIDDIVLSGYAKPVNGSLYVPDIYQSRGPLGGIHAGLKKVKNASALVLAVDTPLLPTDLLEKLIQSHRGGITLLAHDGEIEPLIGIYDRALAQECEAILKGTGSSIRRLLERTAYSTLEYTGAPQLLTNCNTPEEYRAACAY